MDNTSSTVQFLAARFQGQVFIPFTEGAEVLGLAPQTARNKLSQGKFPLPTVLHGSRRVIHIEDLANYILWPFTKIGFGLDLYLRQAQ